MATAWATPKPDLPRLRVVLVRHGESQWNREKRIQGHLGGGLTDQGHADAAATATFLARRHSRPDVVVMSDSERVTETAEPYLQELDLQGRVDPRLREIDNGAWSGRLRTEVNREFTDDLERLRRGEDIRRGGGERVADLADRTTQWLQDQAAEAATTVAGGEALAVVAFSHGGPIRMCAARALGLPPTGHHVLRGLATCSVTEVEFLVELSGTIRSGELVSYNSRHHLC